MEKRYFFLWTWDLRGNRLNKDIKKEILPAPTEGTTEISEKVFVTKKFTQCKTSLTFKIDVFEIPHNKNIWKLFSKFEQLFMDQTNCSSDPS